MNDSFKCIYSWAFLSFKKKGKERKKTEISQGNPSHTIKCIFYFNTDCYLNFGNFYHRKFWKVSRKFPNIHLLFIRFLANFSPHVECSPYQEVSVVGPCLATGVEWESANSPLFKSSSLHSIHPNYKNIKTVSRLWIYSNLFFYNRIE